MNYFRQLFQPSLIRIFLLGVCSGFPWVLIGSALTGWLTDAGLTRSAIGLFGGIFVVYAINFLWAPLLDRFYLLPKKWCTQRKSWIITLLMAMGILCFCIAQLNPNANLKLLALLAFGIAGLSATMDVAIDAYRVEHALGNKIPLAAAMAVSGWWTGYSLLGAFAFFLKGETSLDWAEIFIWMSGFCWFMAVVVMLTIKEQANDRQMRYQAEEQSLTQQSLTKQSRHQQYPRIIARILVTIILPFKDLVARHGMRVILLLLLFLFTFKMGEAFLGRMSITFYKEIGYTNTQISKYSKMVTWVITIVFTLIAAYLNVKLGAFKGLLIGGVTMAGTNLLFALIAVIGPNELAFFFAVLFDGFTSAFATVVLVSFITHLTSTTFSASQYALLASMANFGRTSVSSASGFVVDGLDGNWALFFVLTTLIVIPSLLILVALQRAINARD
ncbi:MFS transporter [Ostreibacterium oceani]|uniref:MFS transporter n=1 Tax=Ostreibacterium oceani TaxID=2654998 RepID=A0A6N7EV68_9GAMM|nr:MFS transporter [Ostreibacterium oceani]MPV85863.1 MFS transporter [Ostreibacterium oceani]